MDQMYINKDAMQKVDPQAPSKDPLRFHRKLPNYEPTPLINAKTIARKLGVSKVLIKDESDRLGLPSFKILGASWAVYRTIQSRFNMTLDSWNTVKELKEELQINRFLTLMAATRGNHGQAVARVARWLDFQSKIFMPNDTEQSRIDTVRSESADVVLVEGNYDMSVEMAADHNGPISWLIQDTAWPGYEKIPGWVMEGYTTMFLEIEKQLHEIDESEPDIIFVQIGAGSLAASIVQFYRNEERRVFPKIIGVEPREAACAFESVREGRIVIIPEPHPSIMNALNCEKISEIAWPYLRQGVDAFITVGDEDVYKAMRSMADGGIKSGESGSAGLAGLMRLKRMQRGNIELRGKFRLDDSSSILIISTEGIMDHY